MLYVWSLVWAWVRVGARGKGLDALVQGRGLRAVSAIGTLQALMGGSGRLAQDSLEVKGVRGLGSGSGVGGGGKGTLKGKCTREKG